jgi:3-hydroxyacyl-[acyl-carrier-protein] dehydratase
MSKAKPFMMIEKIKKYVPHRYPFLLIDRVLSFEHGKKIVALKNISVNEQVFNGHFPVKPVFPGVMIVEALAQASGLLIYLTSDVHEDAEKDLYYFAGIDEVRFKKIVVPGDQLELTAELLQQKNQHRIVKTKCFAHVDGELVCSAEILLIKKGDENE